MDWLTFIGSAVVGLVSLLIAMKLFVVCVLVHWLLSILNFVEMLLSVRTGCCCYFA